jgi:hypothetical protein
MTTDVGMTAQLASLLAQSAAPAPGSALDHRLRRRVHAAIA